jgi:uncharacterized membrane protein YjfL (UPF0719 family)
VPSQPPSPAPEPPATSADETSPVDGATIARAIRRGGTLVALGLIIGPAVDGAVAQAGGRGGMWAATFAVCGSLLMIAGAALADRIFLRGLRTHARSGNVAAAVVGAGHAVAFGVLVSVCFSGRGWPTLILSTEFFVLAAITLLVFQALFRWRTRYADDQEVLGHNTAAALSFVGVTVALAIIVGHAAQGEFTGWSSSLLAYARALLLALALYPVRLLVVQRWLLRLPPHRAGNSLDRVIAQHRDLRVALVEALAYMAVALWATGIA